MIFSKKLKHITSNVGFAAEITQNFLNIELLTWNFGWLEQTQWRIDILKKLRIIGNPFNTSVDQKIALIGKVKRT